MIDQGAASEYRFGSEHLASSSSRRFSWELFPERASFCADRLSRLQDAPTGAQGRLLDQRPPSRDDCMNNAQFSKSQDGTFDASNLTLGV